MRKILLLFVLTLLLCNTTIAFAATKQAKKIAIVYLPSKPAVTESIYGTVYLNPVQYKKKFYIPAKELAKALKMDTKWFESKNIFALNGNNTLAAISPTYQRLVIKKHNRLYNLAFPAREKQGVLLLPIDILHALNVKSSADSTVFYVYPSVLKHVYEKSLDEFVKKNTIYLSSKSKVMSQYTTYFNPNDKNRTANIYLASDYINGIIIPPGQVFSFNKTLGPRSKTTGYKKAIIFFKKEKTEDYGGGICQVSSTIYNAVYHTKLKVLERKSHSLGITYVPKGMDATVSYGYIDFVFKNNKPYPIFLNSEPRGSHLTVKISKY